MCAAEYENLEAVELLLKAGANVYKLPIPSFEQYAVHGITLEEPPRVQRFELCRYLADVARDMVLATPEEAE